MSQVSIAVVRLFGRLFFWRAGEGGCYFVVAEKQQCKERSVVFFFPPQYLSLLTEWNLGLLSSRLATYWFCELEQVS